MKLSERDFQRRVIDLAKLRGWKVAHFHDSRRQVKPGVFVGDADAKGFPDLVLCHYRHGVIYAELKSEAGRLRPEQAAWLEALRLVGARVYLWRPCDWPQIVAALSGAPLAGVTALPPRGDAGAPPRPQRRQA